MDAWGDLRRHVPTGDRSISKGVEITNGEGLFRMRSQGWASAASGHPDQVEEILQKMNHKFGDDKWLSGAVPRKHGAATNRPSENSPPL